MSVTNVEQLVQTLQHAARVVWITGAGLSVASGIAPYRKSADAVWSRFVMDWGTKARFFADTLVWWRDFWLDFHKLAGPKIRPNPGHDAITRLVRGRPDDLVITQNVDGLHKKSGVSLHQLIEIHGRHGLYRCTDINCYRFTEPLVDIDLSIVRRDLIPRCDMCQAKLRPLVLLFDEMYESHPFFRANEAFRGVERADALVFVGTSFAVGATDIALRLGHRRRVPMFNVNIDPFDLSDPSHWRYDQVVDVVGKAEELLPAVANQLLGPAPTRTKRRWWQRRLDY